MNKFSNEEFYKNIISIAGILFPIFQAILFFIVEKSFSKLVFTKQYLINFYQKSGKIISISLIYIILQSILILLGFEMMIFIVLLFFTSLMLIFRLSLLYSTGVWNTMFTSKIIPSNTCRIIKFFYAIFNNRLVDKLFFIFFVSILAIPFLIVDDYEFYSVFSILLYVLYAIFNLLNDPLKIQKHFLKKENTGQELSDGKLNWSEEKIKNERSLLKKQISKFYFYKENLYQDESKLFSFHSILDINKNGESWNNIFLEKINISGRDEFIKRIKNILKEYLINLSECKTDVNSFVVSIHFYIDKKRKNIFVRSNKYEINNNKNLSADKFFKNLKSTIIDELFL